MTLERYALLGYGQNGYDLATRLLWLEISLPSLGPRLPQRGLAALRRRGHQHLHAEGNSHEPKLVRVGIHTFESLCRHSFHTCWSVHCSLGHSQDIWDWFRADSCWRPMALPDRFPALALLGWIRRAGGDGDQFWRRHARGYRDHALVQPLSRKSDGHNAVSLGACGIYCRAAAQSPSLDERRQLASNVGHGGGNIPCFRSDFDLVCEGAAGRSRPIGGWRRGGRAAEDVVFPAATHHDISLGTSPGLPDA